jgi:hypothetical protein
MLFLMTGLLNLTFPPIAVAGDRESKFPVGVIAVSKPHIPLAASLGIEVVHEYRRPFLTWEEAGPPWGAAIYQFVWGAEKI